MNRLKSALEEREEKRKRVAELAGLTESRAWTKEEREELKKLDSEVEGLSEEIELLQKAQSQQAERAKEAAEAEKRASEATREPDVKVTGSNLKTDEARNAKLFKMIQGYINNDITTENEARKSLVEGGHYDDLLGKNKEERNFSTLKDGKGGILIPTTVSSQIFNIEQEYGFIPQFTQSLGDIGKGEIKIPNVLSRPTWYAVNEGSSISGSGLNLGGISLKAHKWGTIIDWTNEVDEAVGSRLMPIIMKQIAEGLAEKKDDTFFNGDGTSSYNGIKGLEALAGTVNYVRTAVAATGNTSFATLDADDFLKVQENVTPGKRSGSVYVMHPDMIFTLMKLKDAQGAYIYGKPSEVAPMGTLWGRRILTSEAFAYADGVSKTVCAFVNPASIAYGNGRNLSAFQMNQGSVTNEDGNTVNLGTSDAQALRVTTLFDIKLDNNTRETAGTAKGAFSVLKTAAV